MWSKSSLTIPAVAALCLHSIGGTTPVFADIINVPGDAPTIQAGIDMAVDGDEVVVADGTYTGDGNRDLDFGGRLITVRSANGPENCIIDCEGTEFDNHRGFFFHSGESAEARVDGLTIRNGWAETGGAGIFIDGSSPTVANCVLRENRVESTDNGDVFGAGMYNVNANPLVVSCTFVANHIDVPDEEGSGSGAGMANDASSPTVIDCLFLLNVADGSDSTWAAGMSSRNGSQPLVVNCRFIQNYAQGAPGAMSVSNGAATVIGCQFFQNTGDHGPGGLGTSNSDSAIINCVFVGEGLANVLGSLVFTNCTMVGGGIVNYDGNVTFTNCVLWPFGISDDGEASTTVTYSDVSGGFEGVGNINLDPMFVAPGNGDYRLSAGSPGIDAGHNWGVPLDDNDYDGDGITNELFPVDLDGNPRFNADEVDFDPGCGVPVVVDMGAFEYQFDPVENVIFADLNGDGSVGVADLLGLLADWGPCAKDCCLADLDLDGIVGLADLLILLPNWG